MLFTKDQQKEFEAFWKSYNFPPDTNAYWLLFDWWLGFRSGQYKTDIDILGDTTAYDCARLLKQLNEARGGEFSLECGLHKGGEKYKNPALLKMLQESLNTTLSAYVEKRKGVLILSKGYGSDTGRAFLIDCTESNPTEATFSKDELLAIIHFEEKTLKGYVRKLEGYKQKDKMNHTAGSTKLPQLGEYASDVINTLKNDSAITDYKAKIFTFDYMMKTGLLEHRLDKSELEKYNGREKKEAVVRWLKAYRKFVSG